MKDYVDLSVGAKVFWDNVVDKSFRQEYVVFKREDRRCLVGIYNETKGKRYAYKWELVSAKKANLRQQRE